MEKKFKYQFSAIDGRPSINRTVLVVVSKTNELIIISTRIDKDDMPTYSMGDAPTSEEVEDAFNYLNQYLFKRTAQIIINYINKH